MNNFDKALKLLQEGNNYFDSIELLSEEAATVARDDGFQFMIYPEPLGNPSFHVRYKDEWEVVLEMFSFKILESKFGPFRKGRFLPSKIKKKIMDILAQKNQLDVIIWKFALQTWNLNNPKYPVDMKTEIPIK